MSSLHEISNRLVLCGNIVNKNTKLKKKMKKKLNFSKFISFVILCLKEDEKERERERKNK